MSKFATNKATPKVAKKLHNPKIKDGQSVLDKVPHPLLLQDAGIDLQERVDDLTRLSRIRRKSFNVEAAERAFELGIDMDDYDPEGLTPSELDGGDVSVGDVSGREEPSPTKPTPPAKQSGVTATGVEDTAEQDA